jgi:hypothetical protein
VHHKEKVDGIRTEPLAEEVVHTERLAEEVVHTEPLAEEVARTEPLAEEVAPLLQMRAYLPIHPL